MARINVEVDDRIYDKYYEHYESEDKYATFSQFLRTAMENQKRCDDLGKTAFPTESNTQPQTNTNQDVKEEIENLKGQLNKAIKSLDNSITQIQVDLQDDEDELVLSSLMGRFHDVLPRVNQHMVENFEVNLQGTSIEDLQAKAIDQGKISSDISEAKTRQALSKLENDVSTVESYVTDEGERHYYEVK